MPSYAGSNKSLNSGGTSGRNSYENIFGAGGGGGGGGSSAGGSVPNTPGRSRYQTNSAQDLSKRSRSNDNLNRRGQPADNNGGALRAMMQQQQNSARSGTSGGNNQTRKQYNSAPNLNRSQEMDVEDVTDDSDADN